MWCVQGSLSFTGPQRCWEYLLLLTNVDPLYRLYRLLRHSPIYLWRFELSGRMNHPQIAAPEEPLQLPTDGRRQKETERARGAHPTLSCNHLPEGAISNLFGFCMGKPFTSTLRRTTDEYDETQLRVHGRFRRPNKQYPYLTTPAENDDDV